MSRATRLVARAPALGRRLQSFSVLPRKGVELGRHLSAQVGGAFFLEACQLCAGGLHGFQLGRLQIVLGVDRRRAFGQLGIAEIVLEEELGLAVHR